MANLITDGIDWFPSGQSTATRTRLWAANNFFPRGNVQTPCDVETGRFGFGQAMLWNFTNTSIGGANLAGYVIPIGAQAATSFIGCGLIVYPDTASGTYPALCFYDGVANTPQLTIVFKPNGVIAVYRGDPTPGQGGTLLANSFPGAFQENEYFHVEIKALIASSGGTCEVRINTVPWVQLTGANTQNTTAAFADCVMIGAECGSNQLIHCAFDDFFVNDASGAQNNSWLGNVRVKTQFMIANGATNNFTIGGSSPAPSHWQSVLNQAMDDTSFEYSSTLNDIDLFTPDPNLNSPLVHVLQVRMGLRQDDATQRVARSQLRIGSTVYPGSIDQFTNQTYTFYKERWPLNPATSVAFTGADVNGLQAGLKITQ